MKPTLTAALQAAARDAGDTRGLVYCEEPGRQTFRGYAALDLRARTVADALHEAGYAAGDAVVIGLRQCLAWVEAAYGVLYAGMTVVPVAITGSDSPERAAEKIARIALAADTAVVITDASLSPALAVALRPDGETATMLFADLVAAGDPDTWTEPDISPDSRALLLFTSGSTGNPKGVIATHRSLVVEADLASAALGFSERTVFVGWLPLYHSMGLTLQWLTPAAIGAHVVLTPPEQFQRRPMFWLQMLSDFGATASAASNFAFELCTKFATDEQVASLDLSRVEVVVSAGEPVRSEAVAAFADRFASTGMRSAAVTPAIGMTETMLYCGKPLTDDLAPRRFDETAREAGRLVATDGPESRELTSCGRPFPGVSVRIVDPETLKVLPARSAPSESLDPRGSPVRRLERLTPVRGLFADPAVAELEDEHRLVRRATVIERRLGDDEVAGAQHPPRGDRGQLRKRAVDGPSIRGASDSLPRLRPVHRGVVVEELVHDRDVAVIDAVDQPLDDGLIRR